MQHQINQIRRSFSTAQTPDSTITHETLEEDKKVITKEGREKWYQTNEDAIIGFTNELMANKTVTGYQGHSRFKVMGAGTSGIKPGWFWNVTYLKTGNFGIADLTKLYTKYFHRDEHIYIEKQFINAERHKSE